MPPLAVRLLVALLVARELRPRELLFAKFFPGDLRTALLSLTRRSLTLRRGMPRLSPAKVSLLPGGHPEGAPLFSSAGASRGICIFFSQRRHRRFSRAFGR